MTKNLLKLDTGYSTYNVSLKQSTYTYNGRLAVMLVSWENDGGELLPCPFSDLTVNLPDAQVSDEACGFVDTNNLPYIGKFLEENNLARPTSRFAASGYCRYPEYRFDLEAIAKYDIG